MLRVTLAENSDMATLKLEGRVRGPWVEELKRSWSELTDRWPARSCVVDLTDVTSIDAGGNELLRTMSREGAKLRGGPLMKFVLDRIERGSDGPEA